MRRKKSAVSSQLVLRSEGLLRRVVKSGASRGRACLPCVAVMAKKGRGPIPFGHSRPPATLGVALRAGGGGNPGIKAVLFDFDGTLTVPGLIDFLAIKKAIHCPANSTILEFINGLSSEREKKKAIAVLEKYECKAANKAQPNKNAEEAVCYLKNLKLKLGILTRNSVQSVKTAMKSFNRISLKDFNVVITREYALKLKPHPEGVLEAGRLFGVNLSELAVVGDYIYDIQAGQKAGAFTVFLESNHTTKWPDPPADWTIKGLDELKEIL